MPDRNITFEIREYLGTIAKYDTNWRKELNIVSWNGGTPKFDIRDWDEQHVKMSKGITLSMWEMRKVVDLYFAYNNERTVARGRAREEERNALRAVPYKRRDASEFDDGAADEPFDENSKSTQMEMSGGETAEAEEKEKTEENFASMAETTVTETPATETPEKEITATEESQEEPF